MMKIVICIEIDPSKYASYFITPSPCRSYLNFWVKVIWIIVYFYIYDWISTLIIIISLSYALHTNSLSQNFGKWLIFQQQKLGHQKTPSASSFISSDGSGCPNSTRERGWAHTQFDWGFFSFLCQYFCHMWGFFEVP